MPTVGKVTESGYPDTGLAVETTRVLAVSSSEESGKGGVKTPRGQDSSLFCPFRGCIPTPSEARALLVRIGTGRIQCTTAQCGNPSQSVGVNQAKPQHHSPYLGRYGYYRGL